MEFLETTNKTWILTLSNNLIMVAFDNKKTPHLISNGLVDIDYFDGSAFDSDGDEKQLQVSTDSELKLISFETLPQDYLFWQNTESCNKKGSLGYVADLLNEANNYKIFETSVFTNNKSYKEAYLWKLNIVKQKYPQLFSILN